MADFLSECFHRSRRPGIVQAFMTGTTAKFEADKEALYSLCYKSACTVLVRYGSAC